MSSVKQIEEKWQKIWEDSHLFEADPDSEKKKMMVTFPYPYMNGPLHVGHAFTASRVDAFARFKRMQGYNVLWPWGWHWTGQPLLGASQRVARGDAEYIRVLREVDGVPEEELKKFVDPLYMAQYYTNEGRIISKRIGFSIDWRREFTTVWPTYQKFIEWQYANLKEKGFVTKGTHPVVWCPKDQSPTGDHDRQVGEGVTSEEYILIKYRMDDKILPAATFRPETIFGVTNIWINPDADYVEALVDGEIWIISNRAAEKLREQERTVEIKKSFKGKEIIGKSFENPLTKKKFPILPGWFVDEGQATGIVYSVPAHAPYDWLALRDLQQNPEKLIQFDIDPEKVQAIKPISLIKLEGYGDYPAVEIVKEMEIKDQHDPKADQATNELYKKEYHSGVLKENCAQYAGKTVREAKDVLTSDFLQMGIADKIYDLPDPVVCRCMTSCMVKVLSDQWFLNYSDLQWKQLAKDVIAQMNIYPDSARQWFLTVVDWLKEWACARTTGFGTPLPWGKGWIIETLSDSTIYMSFYTINKHIRQNNITPESLTREVFDHIFLGKGKLGEVSKQVNIKEELLAEMRNEFLYWYPFDLRNSAKELVPNHLTFCIFHHAAIFPPELWPKAMSVNGMLMIEGKQMHKSKGNFITMKGAVDKYGADATRCGLLLGAEGMDDPDWRSDNVEDIANKLYSLLGFASEILDKPKKMEVTQLERWLMSKLQSRIVEVTESLDQLKTRTALQIAFYECWNDLRWYIQRKGNAENTVLKDAVKIWIRLLSPFAPYVCEELWSKAGENSCVSIANWPVLEHSKVDYQAEEQENLIIDLISDTLNIFKATKISPNKIYFYTASEWKWKIFLKVLEKSMTGDIKINEVMKELAGDLEIRPFMKEAATVTPKIIKSLTKISEERKSKMLKIGKLDEKQTLQNATEFLEGRFNAKIEIFTQDEEGAYDPSGKSRFALPFQPAIFME